MEFNEDEITYFLAANWHYPDERVRAPKTATHLKHILSRLIDISKDELENEELNEADYEFIRNFGEELDSIIAGVEAEGKVPERPIWISSFYAE